MDYNVENRIMNNRKIESNAKMALDEYKLEIGNELNNFNKDEVPYLGGLATRKLVEMGEELLLSKYGNKK